MNVQKNITPSSPQKKSEMCTLCRLFFGSEEFSGLCSKCFIKNKQSQTKQKKQNPKQEEVKLIEQKTEQKPKEQQKPGKPIQLNKKRCFECKKKVGLLGIECRCGYIYCNTHRLPEEHNCEFDHLGAAQEKLKKEIVKVAKGKIEEI